MIIIKKTTVKEDMSPEVAWSKARCALRIDPSEAFLETVVAVIDDQRCIVVAVAHLTGIEKTATYGRFSLIGDIVFEHPLMRRRLVGVPIDGSSVAYVNSKQVEKRGGIRV